MHDRHQNKLRYFKEQGLTTAKYVIPFIERSKSVTPSTRVLEIGCGEAGNLTPFLDLGCECYGIDISKARIDLAHQFFADHPKRDRLTLIAQDIYKVDPASVGKFDVIFMRDVIEHIPDQERFMGFVKQFLANDGVFFLGFPPWYNPFGGHQQICKSKVLSKLPWIHLLPGPLYRGLLRIFGEPESRVTELQEIRDTGISIERFRRILKTERYQTLNEVMYFINPNYETKFGLTPRVQFSLLSAIPFFRNFVVTCCYYLVKK